MPFESISLLQWDAAFNGIHLLSNRHDADDIFYHTKTRFLCAQVISLVYNFARNTTAEYEYISPLEIVPIELFIILLWQSSIGDKETKSYCDREMWLMDVNLSVCISNTKDFDYHSHELLEESPYISFMWN